MHNFNYRVEHVPVFAGLTAVGASGVAVSGCRMRDGLVVCELLVPVAGVGDVEVGLAAMATAMSKMAGYILDNDTLN